MQLILLFVATYLLSRVFVRVDGHLWVLGAVMERMGTSPARLTLGIMGMTCALSTVIPNLITVLAVLPVLQHLLQSSALKPSERQGLTTLLILAVIYAANIGGMASMLGTPANGLFLAALHELAVPEAERLTFGRWLLFGVPLALSFLLSAWAVLLLFSPRERGISLGRLQPPLVTQKEDLRLGCLVVGAASVGIVICAVIASDALSIIATLLLFVSLLRIHLPEREGALLRLSDLIDGIPPRGLYFALGALALAWLLLQFLDLPSWLATLQSALPVTMPSWALLATLVAVTIFLTEVMSNTAAALALWTVAAAWSAAAGLSPFLSMLGIALASTSAFMSPLATPATGMAFGAVQGVSLTKMLGIGACLNLLGILWIVGALETWIPWVLGLNGS